MRMLSMPGKASFHFGILFLATCHGFSLLPFLPTNPPTSSSGGRGITPTTLAATTPLVQGLVHDFERLQTTHNTIQRLRQDIPLLLYRPYTEETAQECFTLETSIVVAGKDDEYVLASSREEMISLQNALLIAVQGPLRATNLLLSRQNLTAPIIGCRFLVYLPPQQEEQVVSISLLMVEWDLKGAVNTNISGTSELILQDGKVSTHRLVKVQWNGQDQDAEAVGNALSRLRQTVRSFQQAQAIQESIPFGSILSQYRNDLIRQLDIVLPTRDTTAPLLVAAGDGENTVQQTNQTRLPAVPGTQEWETYAQSHIAMERFVQEVIPKLALAPPDADFDLQGLFVPMAEMKGLDGNVLLSTAAALAKYYQSLASWRRRVLTTWTLVQSRAVEWRSKTPIVEISFVIDLPGSEASLTGVDRYTLVLEDCGDDDWIIDVATTAIRVESVQQVSMSIGGNSKQQDAVLFMRGLVTAVENDRFANADEQWITDLWKRLRASKDGSETNEQSNAMQKLVLAPTRSDAAAATVYRIMMALHNDGRDLVDTAIVRNSPPALDFMIENMQLRGLINEALLRGRSIYQQNLGLSIGSLRSALRSKRITSVKAPSTKVELTTKGNIRYELTLHLKIEPFAGLPSLLNVPSAGLPLQVDLISEYVLDRDSGRIVQHRVLESRINGQLTPGDLVSRVLLRGQEGRALEDSAWGRVVTELFSRFASNRSMG